MTLGKDFPTAVYKDLGKNGYKQGLQALKKEDRGRISLAESRKCHGSGDIDSSLAAKLPQESRWDYVVAHGSQLHFIEVHPAHTSEVSQVKKKKKWLQAWLRGAQIGKLEADKRFHWVASGKIAITRNSKQARAAAQMGLKPVRQLVL